MKRGCTSLCKKVVFVSPKLNYVCGLIAVLVHSIVKTTIEFVYEWLVLDVALFSLEFNDQEDKNLT